MSRTDSTSLSRMIWRRRWHACGNVAFGGRATFSRQFPPSRNQMIPNDCSVSPSIYFFFSVSDSWLPIEWIKGATQNNMVQGWPIAHPWKQKTIRRRTNKKDFYRILKPTSMSISRGGKRSRGFASESGCQWKLSSSPLTFYRHHIILTKAKRKSSARTGWMQLSSRHGAVEHRRFCGSFVTFFFFLFLFSSFLFHPSVDCLQDESSPSIISSILQPGALGKVNTSRLQSRHLVANEPSSLFFPSFPTTRWITHLPLIQQQQQQQQPQLVWYFPFICSFILASSFLPPSWHCRDIFLRRYDLLSFDGDRRHFESDAMTLGCVIFFQTPLIIKAKEKKSEHLLKLIEQETAAMVNRLRAKEKIILWKCCARNE